MKPMLYYFAALILAGCAHTTSHNAPVQQYRIAGSDKQVTITGRVFVDRNAVSSNNVRAIISFNGNEQILVPLDLQGNGQAAGESYQGKPTSSVCTGTAVTRI